MAEEQLVVARVAFRERAGAGTGACPRVVRRGSPALLGAACWFFAAGAHAQPVSACEQLKSSLAARLPADPRSYRLETVPAAEPVPPGAKAIGTCEGGTRKILFRRADAAAGPATASAAGPASAPPASKPVEVAGRMAAPVAASAPSVVSKPAPRPVEAASAAQTSPQAGKAPVDAVAVGPVGRAEARVDLPLAARPVDDGSWVEKASGLAAGYWHWIGALVFLPLGLWGGAWLAYRRNYDAAGLPRGPRL